MSKSIEPPSKPKPGSDTRPEAKGIQTTEIEPDEQYTYRGREAKADDRLVESKSEP